MNRGLYLARPDPDESDLIETAINILKSTVNNDSYKNYEKIIEIVTQSYFSLKKYYSETEFADFYGLRDFYHLIKQISYKFKEPDLYDDQISRIIKSGIERNFGGKINAIKFMEKSFCKRFSNINSFKNIEDTPVIDLMHENLSDKNSRYLMIIARKDVSAYLIETSFHKVLKEYRVEIGSSFKNNENEEDEAFQTLSNIIRYMDAGISIILQDMDFIYSALYDLFNQNFSKSGNRKYCRVALGAQFNPRCFVHDNFNAIIFINEDDESLKTADAPFLNRFEKHYIKLEQVIAPFQVEIVRIVEKWVETVTKYNEKVVSLPKTSIFPCCSSQDLHLLVLFNTSEEESLTKNVENVKTRLLETASVDIMILNSFNDLDNEEKDFIAQT